MRARRGSSQALGLVTTRPQNSWCPRSRGAGIRVGRSTSERQVLTSSVIPLGLGQDHVRARVQAATGEVDRVADVTGSSCSSSSGVAAPSANWIPTSSVAGVLMTCELRRVECSPIVPSTRRGSAAGRECSLVRGRQCLRRHPCLLSSVQVQVGVRGAQVPDHREVIGLGALDLVRPYRRNGRRRRVRLRCRRLANGRLRAPSAGDRRWSASSVLMIAPSDLWWCRRVPGASSPRLGSRRAI